MKAEKKEKKGLKKSLKKEAKALKAEKKEAKAIKASKKEIKKETKKIKAEVKSTPLMVGSSRWTAKEEKKLSKCLDKRMSAVETAELLGRTPNAIWSRKYKMVNDGRIEIGKSFRSHKFPLKKTKSKR